ncbi:PadR family transcriptional regulator [Paenibacillus lactis]|uniref:PadR family transcriptional regulator n=1 Tax=Paenibacillus lactis TaxID=228574 RepID=UPI001B0ADCCC|nr:PadR family transcriptional regulator [Paenibacillus lactis]GIO89024.1 PadR family transcriptional regulator [Paenibacillus lactis]
MSMKLAILGLLLEGNYHPYEIRSIMKDRGMDQYTKLQLGSLYYAVDRLAEEGYIEAVETIQSDNRPDKTIYRITDAGRKHFEQLLLKKFRDIEPVHHPLYIALPFSRHADPETLGPILQARIRDAEHRVNQAYQLYVEHRGFVPRSTQHLMVGMYEHAKTDLNWLKRLYADVIDGRLGIKGDPLPIDRDER